MVVCHELDVIDAKLSTSLYKFFVHSSCIDRSQRKYINRKRQLLKLLGRKKTTYKLSDHGVVAGVNASDCRDSCTGDLSSLGDLCCVIFRMPRSLESLSTQV